MQLPLQTLDSVGHFLSHDSLSTGIEVYLVGLIALTAWEELVLPRLSETLTRGEREIKWITPLTADSPVPLPAPEQLYANGKHYIGSRGGVPQFISLNSSHRVVPGVCEIDPTWSEVYEEDVYIFKQKGTPPQ